jgi:hypothetical protein
MIGQSIRYFALLLILAFPVSAWAGPEGEYLAEGTDPGNGAAYSGTVSIARNGDTYTVVWNIGGTEYVGTGLGATSANGTTTMGPANDSDTAIAVSYITAGSFGLAIYAQQPDGTWNGIWTYGGSTSIGSEVWTPQ